MRVLVTGGRDYRDKERVRAVLSALEPRPMLVIHGAAPGADTLADEVAAELGIARDPHPARWALYGPSAGPRRNAEMVALRPDLVLAFPGGRGTADCLAKARAAGLDVREVDRECRQSRASADVLIARLSASVEPAIGPRGRTLELRVEVDDPRGRRVQGMLLDVDTDDFSTDSRRS